MVRLLFVLWLSLVALACERPYVEESAPLFRVLNPDPDEALASTRELLRVEATSFRDVDSVRAAGQVLQTVAPGVFEGPVTLSVGLNRIPLEAVDVGGIVGRDTVDLFVVRPLVTLGPALPEGRIGHTATRLADGRVLVTGGAARQGGPASDAVFVLTPGATRFTLLSARLPEPRAGHTATLLPDGRVLFTGGRRGAGSLSLSALVESFVVFDPRTDTFGALPVVGASVRQTRHVAWAAQVDGETRVYVYGGDGDVGFGGTSRLGVRSDVRTFRVDRATAEAIGVGANGAGVILESLAGHAAVPLSREFGLPLSVLVAGGRRSGAVVDGIGFRTGVNGEGRLVETTAATPLQPRTDAASALLVPGVAGLFGGRTAGTGDVTDRVELYLSAIDRYVRIPPSGALVGRAGAAATFLGDGRILITGGVPSSGTALATSLFFTHDL